MANARTDTLIDALRKVLEENSKDGWAERRRLENALDEYIIELVKQTISSGELTPVLRNAPGLLMEMERRKNTGRDG